MHWARPQKKFELVGGEQKSTEDFEYPSGLQEDWSGLPWVQWFHGGGRGWGFSEPGSSLGRCSHLGEQHLELNAGSESQLYQGRAETFWEPYCLTDDLRAADIKANLREDTYIKRKGWFQRF